MNRTLWIALMAASAALAARPERDAVPVLFIANQGQAPAEVHFMAKGSGLTAYFLPGETLFRLGGTLLTTRFLGARPAVEIEGVERLPGQANFLTGPAEEWHLDVPLYGAVRYRELYPGIDMVYGGLRRSLKSEFVVSPGADPSQIRTRYVGAGTLRLDLDGSLVIPVDGRELREEAPTIYQDRGGRRIAIEGHFSLANDGTAGFIIGQYDRDRTLVIDPVLSYSTLLGGSNSDAALAIAVDSTGAAYVAGFTASYDFPKASPLQSSSGGGNDAFVAKLNPAGNGLLYCTYLGGKGDDRAYGLALDSSGAVYITGSTTSQNFPLHNPLQSKLAGGKNAFVAKLSPAGNSLVFSTYLGGNGSDTGNGIAVDSGGNVYLAGDTTSTNFPASTMQTTNRGSQDGFVSKLSADGARLLYSTYLGGSSDDHAAAIALDSSGSAYVTGSTYSTDFPVAAAWQGHLAGGQDAFVAKLAADGNSLVFGTFLGGSGGTLGNPETGQGIALDGQGNAYVTGVTSSSDFPLLQPLQSARGGWMDAFVSKFNASGVLSYSTYLGGTGVDAGNAITVDSSGNAYVVGQTFSSDLPVTNAVQASSGGDYDAFWAEIAPSGSSLVALSYLGGNGADTATAVALGPSGYLYIAGWTLSTNFPLLSAYQSTNAGNYGAFVTKVLFTSLPSVLGVTPNSGSGALETFSFRVSDSAGASDITTVSVLFNSSASTANACSVTYNRVANTLTLLTDSGAAPGSTITPGSGSQQNSQCSLNGAASSVSLAGNVLTLNLALVLEPAFSGSKSIYMQAASPAGSTAWAQQGTWTVPSVAPAPVSVTPNAASGSTQTFHLVYSDPNNFASGSSVSVNFNTSPAAAAGCDLVYLPATAQLSLATDAGTAWTGPVTPGQSGTLQNSQCSVSAAGSSASLSAGTLTLNLAVTFFSAFSGTKTIYMEVLDGVDSGWVAEGAFTVVMGPPTPVSVTPSSGTGASQTFAFVFSGPSGYGALAMVRVYIASAVGQLPSCYFLYYPGSRMFYLANDASNGWAGTITIGTSGTVQNSQCTLNAATSSVSGSGNNLTLNVALTFQPAFSGNKNVYLDAWDANNQSSGWQQKGTWTTAVVVMGPVSITPNSGTGSSQTFTFAFSDPSGYGALSMVRAYIAPALGQLPSCYFLYYPGTRMFYLANDASNGWAGTIAIGTSGTVQNSQCTLNAATSSVSGSGNNLTLNVALSFLHAFSGTKNIYVDAYDGVYSGWLQKGTWTVP